MRDRLQWLRDGAVLEDEKQSAEFLQLLRDDEAVRQAVLAAAELATGRPREGRMTLQHWSERAYKVLATGRGPCSHCGAAWFDEHLPDCPQGRLLSDDVLPSELSHLADGGA